MIKSFKNNSILIKLDETTPESMDKMPSNPMDCELLKVGMFSYDEPNDMILSKEVFDSMIKNFDTNAKGSDIPIGYSHCDFNEAAGWIKKLSMSEDNSKLMANIQWNKEGLESIAEKEFRYLSAEFYYEYENQDGIKCGPIITGAVLTNKPFMKNMKPLITLSESEIKQRKVKMEKKLEEMNVTLVKLSDSISRLEKSNQEKDEQIKKLSEQNASSKVEKELAEKNNSFNVMLSEGKVVEAQRESYLNGDTKKFSELASTVKLNVVGSDSNVSAKKDYATLSSEEAEDEILRLSSELVKTDKISLTEAHKKVIRENKVLGEKYRSKFSF